MDLISIELKSKLNSQFQVFTFNSLELSGQTSELRCHLSSDLVKGEEVELYLELCANMYTVFINSFWGVITWSCTSEYKTVETKRCPVDGCYV